MPTLRWTTPKERNHPAACFHIEPQKSKRVARLQLNESYMTTLGFYLFFLQNVQTQTSMSFAFRNHSDKEKSLTLRLGGKLVR